MCCLDISAAQPQITGGATPKPTPEKAKPAPTPDQKGNASKLTSAEQIVETTLYVYGLGGGRAKLDQIRKTTIERGKLTLTGSDGKVQEIGYDRFIVRGSNLAKEKIRIDQDFPDARYALVWADEKTFGVYNSTIFAPRDDVARSFENNIFRGVEGLLRYKENGSSIELAGREKEMGVEYYFIDVTDKQDRKTRYYLSTRTFRLMMLTYEEGGIKYKRKFYDQNYTQGTLVAYHSVLTANGKVVEENTISSITYGQKVDEEMFKSS